MQGGEVQDGKAPLLVALSSAVLQKPGRIFRKALEVEGDGLSLSTHMGPGSCLAALHLSRDIS